MGCHSKKDSCRVTKELRSQAEMYDWGDITFPRKVKDFGKWEKANGIGVNVFGYDEHRSKLYTIKVCDPDLHICKIVSLYLHDDLHNCAISDLSRLVSSQLSKKEHRKHICLQCISAFGTEKLLAEHEELCRDQELQRPIYPKKGKNLIRFKNYERTQVVPFAIYADFECYVEPIDHADPNPKRSFTTQYQRHRPSGFCYIVKCFDESIYKTKTVLYTARGTSVTCNKCNLRMRVPKFVPVLFHNLEGYDSHLFIKSLGYNTNENIRCIPRTDEKYISFSKRVPVGEILVDKNGNKYRKAIELRFLDSLKFTQSSLVKLVGNLGEDQFRTLEKEMGTKNIRLLRRKGVFLYEFMSGFDKLTRGIMTLIRRACSFLTWMPTIYAGGQCLSHYL